MLFRSQDASLLTRAGLQSSANLLPLSLALKHEENEKVYSMAVSLLNELRKFVDNNDTARTKLKKISANFVHPILEQLGWDERLGESDDDRERRSTALGLMLYGEDQTALSEANHRFTTTQLDKLPTEIRSLIISASVKHFETPQIITELLQTYAQTPSNDLQLDIALGLTSSKNPDTVKTLLFEIKRAKIIRPQDASRWFIYLMRNREARNQTWRWLQKNWDWIKETFSGDKSYDDFLRYTASSLLTRTELEEFITFTAPLRTEPALTRTIDLGITEITARVELIERDQTGVLSALQITL